jgi:hypothetical protein
LFGKSSHGDQLFASPAFSGALSATPPFCFVLIFSSLFIVQFLFLCMGGLVCPGGYAGLSQEWLGKYHVMLGAHLLVCQMSPKQVWSQPLAVWQPSCFLSVMWCGETFHGLGVQGVKVLILLAALFPASVAQCLHEVLKSRSSHHMLLYPSCHLGSLLVF